VVVEVLVRCGDAQNALGQHGPLIMHNEPLIAGIEDDVVQCVQQADLAIDFPKQQQSGVAGKVPALEIRDNLTTIEAGEQEGLRGTVCHVDGLSGCVKNYGKSLYSN